MFKPLSARERELYEARLKDCARLNDVLAEQIEYLRMLLGRPHFGSVPSQNPSEQPVLELGTVPYVSEEEEELLAARQAGAISDDDLEKALKEIGALNTTIEQL